MKIAIITGASSGLGREFIKQSVSSFSDTEEFWLIARREERIKESIEGISGVKFKIIPLDLALDQTYYSLEELLDKEKPEVKLLFNNAGLGYWGEVKNLEVKKQINCIDVNVKAVTAITPIVLKYMSEGSKIIFTSSIASFVPNAYMTVYSSTKAFITSYARALRYELKKQKIFVTVVCPGPMATEFIEVGGVESKTFQKLPYCKVEKVVKGTIKSAKKGKFIYTNKLFYKFYRLLAKILPMSIMMPLAKT